MKKSIITLLLMLTIVMTAGAQVARVYDETIDPMAQIDAALKKAAGEGHNVVCQVGGNWCPWCLRFAAFVKSDTAVAKVIADNYEFIHVNYPRKGASTALMSRLGNPGRFGFPVLVVLSPEGKVLHIQDSSFLEEGKGYDPKKVLRFFKCWTPAAVHTAR